MALDAVHKLCRNAHSFSAAYEHPGCRRTSNMLDRHLDALDRYLYGLRYFHGHLASAQRSVRGWALAHNFMPFCPRAEPSKRFISPAHRLNGFVYRENWLENLFVSASLGGRKCWQQTPLELEKPPIRQGDSRLRESRFPLRPRLAQRHPRDPRSLHQPVPVQPQGHLQEQAGQQGQEALRHRQNPLERLQEKNGVLPQLRAQLAQQQQRTNPLALHRTLDYLQGLEPDSYHLPEAAD